MIKHPCFDGHEYSCITGRIHIPLVESCNIKCTYCNRKCQCVNENRPGVTAKVLSVEESLECIEKYQRTNLKIIGLAGPGDPFSEPNKLLEFICEVRERYGNKYEVCISSNGFNMHPYLYELKELGVNYLTVTMNTVDSLVLQQLVEWVQKEGKIIRGREAADILLQSQMNCVESIAKMGVNCKVNTVIVPDVNQYVLDDLLQYLRKIGIKKSNLIPLIPVKGTIYENTQTLSMMEYREILEMAEKYIDPVKGCKKCRADAVFVK